MKKITLATVKSFIRKHRNDLWINNKSNFDGMYDCVMPLNGGFRLAKTTDEDLKNTAGVSGAWFVGGSRNYFCPYEDDKFTGIEVFNCCGRFVLAALK